MAGNVSKTLERANWKRVLVKRRGAFKSVIWLDPTSGETHPQYYAHQIQVSRNKINREAKRVIEPSNSALVHQEV